MKVEMISVEMIVRNESQPRQYFNKERILELSQSIKEHGVLQPIIVKDIGGKFEIIAGERRFRASVEAGLKQIPAIVKDSNDLNTSKVALVENIQRENLSAIEEALAFQVLIEEYGLSQQEIAQTIGKNPSTVSNKLRLLKLDNGVQECIKQGAISERHGRFLLQYSQEEQRNLAKRIIKEELTVAQLESLGKKKSEGTFKKGVVSKDYRLALNTIKQAVQMIEKSGFKVKMNQSEENGSLNFNIKVTR